MIKVVVWWLRS